MDRILEEYASSYHRLSQKQYEFEKERADGRSATIDIKTEIESLPKLNNFLKASEEHIGEFRKIILMPDKLC